MSFLITLFYICSSLFPIQKDHKFYVSTTTMVYKEELKLIQITSQLFIDDVETLLREAQKKITLAPDSDPKQIDLLLEAALKRDFRIQIDQLEVAINYLGREYKNEILQCYFEISVPENAQQLRVQNAMLFTLFEEQQNIIHYKSKEGRKSTLLHREKQSEVFSLQ